MYLLAIVLGHITAAYIAHVISLKHMQSQAAALRSQHPMPVLMVLTRPLVCGSSPGPSSPRGDDSETHRGRANRARWGYLLNITGEAVTLGPRAALDE